MRHLSRICGIALFALLAGCSRDDVLQKFTNEAEQARALDLIESMRRGDVAKLEPLFDRGIIGSTDFPALIAQMSALMPAGEPTRRTLVGANFTLRDGARFANLTYEFGFAERVFLVNCATLEKDGKFTIVGMQIRPLNQSLEEANKVSLKNKSGVHYLFFLLATAAVAISLTALILCVVDRTLRRKWLWVVFIVFGVTQFSVNWSTGAYTFSPLSLQLFSAGASATPYGPWILSFSLPIGAVVYLLRRRLRNHLPAAVSNET